MAIDWDKRYREGFYAGAQGAHGLVQKYAHLMPMGKPVVDIAMGTARDLLFLCTLGFQGYGLERSREAIKLARETIPCTTGSLYFVLGDASRLPFRPQSAGTVLVFYFLIRDIMAELVRLVAPGGLILYETFLKRQNEIDGPRNPAYLLDDGELITYFDSLELVLYEEGIFTKSGKRRAIARYVGRKG